LVIIVNAVGFCVSFLSHPVNVLPVVSTWTRSARSTKRHSSSVSNLTARRRGMPDNHEDRLRRHEAIMEGLLARLIQHGENGRDA